jgi:hypothetical protein
MPAGDRTGPIGMGPRTGRAMGDCREDLISGYGGRHFGNFYGRGLGNRGGFGGPRGRFNTSRAPEFIEDNFHNLQDEVRYLEQSLKDVKNKLHEHEQNFKEDSAKPDSE